VYYAESSARLVKGTSQFPIIYLIGAVIFLAGLPGIVLRLFGGRDLNPA
jgi:hypothetical protein